MTTPYSSFTTVDRYLSKENPMPFSSFGEVYRERMEFFNLGETIGKIGSFLSSEEVKSVTSGVKNVASTVKSLQAKNPVTGTKTGSVVNMPAPTKASIWSTHKVAIISSAAVVVALIATIIIIKLRKK